MSLRLEYVNIKVNVKYFIQKNLLHKYDSVAGHQYINKEMTKKIYEQFSQSIYGNKYIHERYTDNSKQIMKDKEWIVDIIDRYLKPEGEVAVCDAGANRGYLMEAFRRKGYRAYGFDILEDKSSIIESPEDIIRKSYKLGSILSIPYFEEKFQIVTCMNVFEHIPINYTDQMAQELLRLQPRYFVFEISKDAISPGHITLKGTRWWTRKFKGYRVMNELTPKLKKELTLTNEFYQYTGVPRNAWNHVPGICFLERIEESKENV